MLRELHNRASRVPKERCADAVGLAEHQGPWIIRSGGNYNVGLEKVGSA
jgi:hypothetical protein